jgi:hypothetical protein
MLEYIEDNYRQMLRDGSVTLAALRTRATADNDHDMIAFCDAQAAVIELAVKDRTTVEKAVRKTAPKG